MERKLRRTGLELHGIRYNGEAVSRILKRYGEGISVRVVFDPDDLGEVQVWGPEDEAPATVRAIDFEYAQGLTVQQNELIREAARAAGADAEDRVAIHRARAEIAGQIESLMLSRKLRARRKSAVLRGISSSQPEGKVSHVEAPSTPLPPARRKPEGTNDELPPLLTSFSLRSRGGA